MGKKDEYSDEDRESDKELDDFAKELGKKDADDLRRELDKDK